MKHLNIKLLYACIGMLVVSLFTQSCSTEVGGDEDKIKPVTTISGIIDADSTDGEIIGEATIQWTTVEPNKSTVDIHLSSDSGANFDTVIELNAPDTGEYVLDTNTVSDCRTCRLRIIPTDVVGNVGDPSESSTDFIINNVPQVLGTAYYADYDNNGASDGDTIRVPFDKDVKLLTAIASDIFIVPVLGDSIGPFATVKNGDTPNELIITLNNIAGSSFHLHARGVFNPEKLNQTAPSGLNILDNLAEGILFANDTGRTAAPAVNGIDVAPEFVAGQGFGGDTTAIILGDIDGDGDLDLVRAGGVGSGGVFVNDGGGMFANSGQTLNGALKSNSALAFGDVDGNGALDLVIGDSSGASSIWLNDGSGVFTDSGQAIGTTVSSLALADIDGDDDIDLLLGNGTVWINNDPGVGVFTDSGQALGFDTSDLALADLDGDDDIDLVTGVGGGANRVWLNNGSGVFTASSQNLGDGFSSSVLLGDVNADGSIDVVFSNGVWINNGSGVFSSTGQVLATNPAGLGDFDGDGDLDFIAVFGAEYAEGNRIWINNGSGFFTDSGQSLTVGDGATRTIAIGDVDGDGDLDFVEGNLFDNDRVWLNSQRIPASIFIDSEQALGFEKTFSVILGDIDGDNDMDLLSRSTGEELWLNDGAGVFIEAAQLPYDGDPRALNDFDGDGDLDLVTRVSSGDSKILLNNGNGTFIDSGQLLDFGFSQPTVGDVDGVNGLDIIARTIWLNNGSGIFSDTGQVLGGVLGDVDGDRDLDLIVGSVGGANQVWLNNGSGFFTDSGQALGVDITNSIAQGDVDGDGDLDFVAGNGGGANNLMWLNDGNGNFIDSGQVLGAGDTRAVILEDVDDDDDLDLVTATGSTIILWLNNGKGVFTESGQPLGKSLEFTNSIAMGDVDGDGDPDLVVGNEGVFVGQVNRVWLNDY